MSREAPIETWPEADDADGADGNPVDEDGASPETFTGLPNAGGAGASLRSERLPPASVTVPAPRAAGSIASSLPPVTRVWDCWLGESSRRTPPPDLMIEPLTIRAETATSTRRYRR